MEAWITLALGVVVVPSIAWLVREVLSLRGEMIKLQTCQKHTEKECLRHQIWAAGHQRILSSVAKNISRLCMKAGVDEID
jgi:hypothetical protein